VKALHISVIHMQTVYSDKYKPSQTRAVLMGQGVCQFGSQAVV